ncbi:MAG: ParA family protein [Oligoflexales bacterium]|nr:ParA family protein [Oligoflexales bacterium]
MIRVVFNQKGGVGKTSITCNLAASLAYIGKKVLVIDLDSQCNSSQYLLGDAYIDCKRTVADFFESTVKLNIFGNSLREAVQKTKYENLWLIPSSSNLADLQTKLESKYKIFKLKQALTELIDARAYDEVLIDTPPALNFYSMSSLISADRVLIPFDCDAFSAHAILQVMDTVEEVAADHQPNLKVEGIIINHFQAQAKLPREAIDSLLAKDFPILTPYLSSSILMKESHGKNKPLVFMKPNHKLSQEFLDLAKKLVHTGKSKKTRAGSVKNLNL